MEDSISLHMLEALTELSGLKIEDIKIEGGHSEGVLLGAGGKQGVDMNKTCQINTWNSLRINKKYI